MEKTIDERGVAKLWGKVKEYVEREGDSGSHTHDDRYYTEEEIDVKMKEQQNQIDIVRNNTADAFDETKTYAVGNYCIYNNVLYKCKTAVTEAGPWNEDNWAITTVEAEISELKTTMEGEISELNSNKIVNISMVNNYSTILNLTELSCIQHGKNVYLKINLTTKTQFVGWTTIAYNLPSSFLNGNTYFQTPNAKFQVDTSGNLKMAEAASGAYIDTMISYPCK